MSPSTRRVLEEALALADHERIDLLEALIEILHDAPADSPADVETAWAQEITRRLADVETGAVKPMPWDEARKINLRIARGWQQVDAVKVGPSTLMPVQLDHESPQDAAGLVESWLADESDYDERVWTRITKTIEKYRLSERSRLNGSEPCQPSSDRPPQGAVE